MYFGDRFTSPKVENLAEENFNPNYEQDFYNEFYNIYYLAEGELDFDLKLSSLLEGEYDLDIVRKAPWEPEEKGPTIGERIKQMVNVVIKWLKEAFVKLAKLAEELFQKIRNNTARDQVLQKLFKNFKYSDIEKAKEKGWKGIPKSMWTPSKFEQYEDTDVYGEYVKQCRECKWSETYEFELKEVGEDKLEGYLDNMLQNYTLENAKEKYNLIMEELKKRKNNIELNRKDYLLDKYANPKQNVKGYQPTPSEKTKEGYYIPVATKFAVIQDIVFNSRKQLVQMRKGFEDNFLKIYKQNIADDKLDLKATKAAKDTSDNKSKEIYTYYLKAKLAFSSFKLGVAKNIMSECVKTINDTFHYAFRVFAYIVSSCKSYIVGNDIKEKVTGKKEEPVAASYIDYGMGFVVECGLI